MSTPKHQIVASSASFTVDPENPALELYILAQGRKGNPRVCFVPAASGATQRCCPRYFPRRMDFAAWYTFRCVPGA